jgi:hypothetical protein
MDRLVFVVRRERIKLRDSLQSALGGEEKIDVILDRRLIQRRRVDATHSTERRRWDRRLRPFADVEVSVRGWSVVRIPTLD